MIIPLITVVIVSYKSQNLLNGCLTSISQFNDLSHDELEVIIVDNSPAEDAKLVEKVVKDFYHLLRIKYIGSDNVGYGAGNNLGINSSSAEIVCIMNPDIILTEKMFASVVNRFLSNKNVAIIGYKQRGGKNISFHFKPEYDYPILSSLILKFLNNLNLFIPKIHFLSGAYFFIDKKKFKEAGLFDPNIFMYYEEADIARRLSSYQIVYDKSISYQHLEGDRESSHKEVFVKRLLSLDYYIMKYSLNRSKILLRMSKQYRILQFIATILQHQDVAQRFAFYVNAVKQTIKKKTND